MINRCSKCGIALKDFSFGLCLSCWLNEEGIKKIKYECIVCKKQFDSKREIDAHKVRYPRYFASYNGELIICERPSLFEAFWN